MPDNQTPFIVLMQILPRNLISFFTGCMARLVLPGPFQGILNRVFVGLFKINMSEAEQPLANYPSIEAVFTRKLKQSARLIESASDRALVSPSDGFLARSGPIVSGQLLQAKGLDYDAVDLVYGSFAAKAPKRDYVWFTTVYLAPHNYHRVHSSVGGHLPAIRYIPGSLWPVNIPLVENLPRLFCRNERLIFDIETEGGGMVHVVMVGAFNVGRIETPHLPGFATNTWSRIRSPEPREFRLSPGVALAPGDELGTFLLGSTVVLVFDRTAADRFHPVQAEGNRPILMGQKLN